MKKFKLQSDYKPNGDQPHAIEKLVNGLKEGQNQQTLLGVTGSGKTFTMANIIEQHQKPTLILSHNKSLAAQLYEEFKTFFPENNVCFFISYYDYYQPESYLVQSDTFIEKETQVNERIEQYRMEAVSSLITNPDTIVVSSVSCIYGLGDPKSFEENTFLIYEGQQISRKEFLEVLIKILYTRNDAELKPGTFRVRGDIIDILSGDGKFIVRVEIFGRNIRNIKLVDKLNNSVIQELKNTIIYPATPFIFNSTTKDKAMSDIQQELENRIPELDTIQAYRLKQRTDYDLEMINELGYCMGIENYSRHFEGRNPGEPPSTLMDFFPDDFLFFIDESHVTLPQVRAMYKGDQSRKQSLVDHGFRLPSALDNRPLKFNEFENYLKSVIYVSATPGDYELEKSTQVAEQIIRPTGLLDPEIYIQKTEGQIDYLIGEIDKTVEEGGRILVTTLTKRMAEELNKFLTEQGIRCTYLHSEVDTLDRIQIIKDLRLGRFDVLIGINLLREGLDLPEVSLVCILDADKQGFLRTTRSLIQTIGRAARNAQGRVVLFADKISPAMKEAMEETSRRRALQIEYNEKNGITPQTIIKKQTQNSFEKTDDEGGAKKKKSTRYTKEEEVIYLEAEMNEAANRLDFEKAIELREQIKSLKESV